MNRFSAALVVGLVAFVAGCGGGGTDPDEFADQVKSAMKPVEQSATSDPDPAKISKFADALDQSADRLKALEPPDGSQDELDATVKAIQTGADRFREAADALKSKDPEALTKVGQDLNKSMDEISKAGQALEDSVNK
jgi:hypothetical protein